MILNCRPFAVTSPLPPSKLTNTTNTTTTNGSNRHSTPLGIIIYNQAPFKILLVHLYISDMDQKLYNNDGIDTDVVQYWLSANKASDEKPLHRRNFSSTRFVIEFCSGLRRRKAFVYVYVLLIPSAPLNRWMNYLKWILSHFRIYLQIGLFGYLFNRLKASLTGVVVVAYLNYYYRIWCFNGEREF